MAISKKDNSDLEGQLRDRSSVKRRAAAKQLGLLRDPSTAQPLFEAFLREREDCRTYETQAVMARSLGLLGHFPAAEEFLRIIQNSPDHDLVSCACSTAYCRISRSSLSDVRPVLQILLINRFSASMGALEALGCDRMVPSEKDVSAILAHANKFCHQKGFGDPRYGAAVAAAGWNGPEVDHFLRGCLTSGDSGVVAAAQSSLMKKYVRCR